jgi:site-specific DNA-methyltransferase (adenine-specific)
MKKLQTNKIYNIDCVKGMKMLPNEYIDLTVTSPPYDDMRTYNGFSFDFEAVANELYRITKQGGVIVWVVGDQTVNGSESGTSFKQALYFKEIGFNLHDSMIWQKNSSTFPANENSNRYTQIFEYMFVFSKGKPKTIKLIKDKENKWAGFKDFSGKLKKPVPEKSVRNNIWKIITSFNDKTEHPAVFPEQLVNDHILTWSNEKDLILDPFMGSGTTAKMARLNNRDFIGFELSKEYCDIANQRIKPYMNQLNIFDMEV